MSRFRIECIFILSLFYCSSAVSESLGVAPFIPFSSAKVYATHPYGIGEDGILYFDYGNRYDGLGKYRNPTFITAYANAIYRDFIQGDKKSRGDFLKQVDFLINSASCDEQGCYWAYHFVNEYYDAPEGWYSGMTSGRVLGVLIRAHHITEDQHYLRFAEKVFKKLSMPLKEGGMSTYTQNGVWIEEVAYDNAKSFKVLNGHVFGLAGVYEYARYLNDEEIIEYSEKAVNAVLGSLDDIDAGYISYYSESMPSKMLRPFAERGGYNSIHIMQMLWLYEISGNVSFLEKALKFQNYENFEPIITSSFSTNPTTNGPEKMNLTFGNNYWSSYRLPVVLDIDLGGLQILNGINIIGHTPESAPRDLFVEVLYKGEWKGVARTNGNSEQRLAIDFTYPVHAHEVKVSIYKDNGNKAVALDGIGFRKTNAYSPVVDFANYTSGVKRLVDKDFSTGILVKNSGFLLIPNASLVNKVDIYGEFSAIEKLAIQGSDDLAFWQEIPLNAKLSNGLLEIQFDKNHLKFIKLNFDRSEFKRISEIVFIE